MDTRELSEMGTIGAVGVGGVMIPNLHETAAFFSGITPIVSFFLIVIPTGIWAWFRAIHFIRNMNNKVVNNDE